MTQYDHGTISPAISGTALAEALSQSNAAKLSGHSGAARPSYATAGLKWVKVVSATIEETYLFDGTQDVHLWTINPTTHEVVFAGALSAANNLSDVANAAQALTNLGGVSLTYLSTTLSSYYQKTDFKADGTANAPVKYGASGELFGKELSVGPNSAGGGVVLIKGTTGHTSLLILSEGTTYKWSIHREANNDFVLWNHIKATYGFLIDGDTGVVNFPYTPTVGGQALALASSVSSVASTASSAASTASSAASTANSAYSLAQSRVPVDVGVGGVGMISPMYATDSVGPGGLIGGSRLKYLDYYGNTAAGTWREIAGNFVSGSGASIFQRIA